MTDQLQPSNQKLAVCLRKGQVLNGPDGQYYTARKDVRPYDFMNHETLMAGGGAPRLKEGDAAPDWVLPALDVVRVDREEAGE